jgi:hypothetical protein
MKRILVLVLAVLAQPVLAAACPERCTTNTNVAGTTLRPSGFIEPCRTRPEAWRDETGESPAAAAGLRHPSQSAGQEAAFHAYCICR